MRHAAATWSSSSEKFLSRPEIRYKESMADKFLRAARRSRRLSDAANKEGHVAFLKQGLADWNAWHEDDLDDADLRGADLSGADLRGANLEEVDLRGANLEGADLGKVDLGEAN